MQLTQALKEEVKIQALVTKVWHVLTSPQYTKQYLFDVELICDWKTGSTIFCKLEPDKNTDAVLTGRVIQIEPLALLQFTVPALNGPDSGMSTVCYELVPHNFGTQLKLTSQANFPSVELYRIMSRNWHLALQKIKWLAEYA